MVASELHTSVADTRHTRSQPRQSPPADGVIRGITHVRDHQSLPLKRAYPTSVTDYTMPVTTSSQSLLATLPSFMSVFGDGIDTGQSKVTDTGLVANAPARNTNFAKRPPFYNNLSSPLFRRGSASTFESTESSPTTTISTLDSSITEPSPSSSPDSPNSLLPLSQPNPSPKASMGSARRPGMDGGEYMLGPFAKVPHLSRADSPNKKMRNTKNLSVNTSASSRQGPQLPKMSLSTNAAPSTGRAFSAPATPSFIVPPKPPRKRPSNLGLSLAMPENSPPTQPIQNRSRIAHPPTPLDPQPRTFRFLQTTTNSQTVSSPTVAPEGGMRLPPFSKSYITTRLGKTRPPLGISRSADITDSSPITLQTLEHVQEENDYDLPLSREVKSPAYPEGPVCIYDPHVYLYLEPSDIEASEFDVVLNVAREVKNPFTVAAEEAAGYHTKDAAVQVSFDSRFGFSGDRNSISEPQTAVSDKSFRSAFETQPEVVRTTLGSPKAPKAAPEYIHIPWDHNTNVVDDLLRLCELIDDRVQNGKRVLIHCQCGVSRSASLVVAYGLYKNPHLTVQDAYNAVKERSRWIGPNMNLIYQLSEFKAKLPKTSISGVSTWHSLRNGGSGRSNRNVPAVDSRSNPLASLDYQQEPTSAQFRKDEESTPARANSFSPSASAQMVETPVPGDITPGPSSAPPDMQWTPGGHAVEIDKDEKRENVDEQMSKFIFPWRTPSVDNSENSSDLTSLSYHMDTGSTDQKADPSLDPKEMDIDITEKKTESEPEKADPSSAYMLLPTPMDIDTDCVQSVPISLPSMTNPGASVEMRNPSLSQEKLDIGIDERKPASTSSNNMIAIGTAVPLSPFVNGHENGMQELAPKTPSSPPTQLLPAGFTSMSTRRAQRQLPFRQEPLRLANPQLTHSNFDQFVNDDAPQTPSLLSPRAAEFTASPFHRTTAGDLAGTSVFEQALMSPKLQVDDPRSPATRGEAPITRSIFDVL